MERCFHAFAFFAAEMLELVDSSPAAVAFLFLLVVVVAPARETVVEVLVAAWGFFS